MEHLSERSRCTARVKGERGTAGSGSALTVPLETHAACSGVPLVARRDQDRQALLRRLGAFGKITIPSCLPRCTPVLAVVGGDLDLDDPRDRDVVAAPPRLSAFEFVKCAIHAPLDRRLVA